MSIRQIKFEELGDEFKGSIAHGDHHSTYATLKAVASLLPMHHLELVVYETGSDIDFSIDAKNTMAAQMIIASDLRLEGDLIIVPGFYYNPEAYTPGDDPYGRADANQPLDALEAANRLVAYHNLEIVMDDAGDWLLKIVKLGYSPVTPEFDDPFNGTVKRVRGPVEVSPSSPTMEQLLRAAGVDPGLATLIESPMVIPTSDTPMADAEDGMRTFAKAIPTEEADIEIDVQSLDLDEVIDLLKDRAMIGKVREQLHRRLDMLVLR